MKRAFIVVVFGSMLVGHFTVTTAQVKVTGHIFAEVVEVAQTTGYTQNFFNVQRHSAQIDLDLGEVVFNGLNHLNCVVMINTMKANGVNVNWGDQSISDQKAYNISLDQKGAYVMKLAAHIHEETFHKSEQDYSGNYEVILAFN